VQRGETLSHAVRQPTKLGDPVNSVPVAAEVQPDIDLLNQLPIARLAVRSDLDIQTTDAVRDAGLDALAAGADVLRLDLSDVPFIDSTGLSALVAIRNEAEATAATLILERPSRQVRRLLALTGLTEWFTIDMDGGTGS
jgi:anti-sigma B factor antagonist